MAPFVHITVMGNTSQEGRELLTGKVGRAQLKSQLPHHLKLEDVHPPAKVIDHI